MKNLKFTQKFIIGCDYSLNTGEGVLANDYLQTYKSLKTDQILKKKNFFNFLNKKGLIHRYILPLLISIYVRINYRKKFIYINYLPLWNFLVFLILPQHTILGPITGSLIQRDKNNTSRYIRKNVFPLFYKISLFIISKKFKKIIFSTDLLKKNFSTIQNKILSNYVVNNFKIKKKIKKLKKKYDIIFYFRKHDNKNHLNLNKIIEELADYKLICVIGDVFKTKSKNIINYGHISREKVQHLMRKTSFAICGPDNLYSLFAIDGYNNNCRLIVDKNLKKYQLARSENIDFINYYYSKNNIIKFLKILKNNKFRKDLKFKKKIQIKKNQIKKFLKDT